MNFPAKPHLRLTIYLLRAGLVTFTLLVGLLSGAIPATPVAAQAPGFHIEWFTIDGGGGRSQSHADSSGYQLSGTAGQLGAAIQSGGAFRLVSGLGPDVWATRVQLPSPVPGVQPVYLPVVGREQ